MLVPDSSFQFQALQFGVSTLIDFWRVYWICLFVFGFKGPRHLRRRGEADCFSSWRSAESRQAHLCQTSKDPVSLQIKSGQEGDWGRFFFCFFLNIYLYLKMQVQRRGRGCCCWQNHWGKISQSLQKVRVWRLGSFRKTLEILCPFSMTHAGATETVEGGNQLSAGLCTPVVVCQSAWRRTGEMLKNTPCWLYYQGKFVLERDISICHLNLTLMLGFRGGDRLRMSLPWENTFRRAISSV